jgi:hypothetical protein
MKNRVFRNGRKIRLVLGGTMRSWYFFNKFLGGVLMGMICGGTVSFLLMATVLFCWNVLS